MKKKRERDKERGRTIQSWFDSLSRPGERERKRDEEEERARERKNHPILV